MNKLVAVFALSAFFAFPAMAEEAVAMTSDKAQNQEQFEVAGTPAGPQAARLGKRRLSPAGFAITAAAFGAMVGAVGQAGDTSTTATTGTTGTTQ